MSPPCRPLFTWGFEAESTLTLAHPMRPWNYADGGEGGSAVAASGITEAYVIREDDVLMLECRVLESEMPAFRQFLRWARSSGESFTLRLDSEDAATEFQVYLESPTWADSKKVQHTRNTEFNELFIIPIEVRPELGGTFDVSWFALATIGGE